MKSFISTLAGAGIATLLAAGTGGAVAFLGAPMLKAPEPVKVEPPSHAVQVKFVAPLALRELPPIVTNLVTPSDAWVRLEASIVLDPDGLPQADATIREIAADTLAYLRTVALPELQGPSGLANLRQDLNERLGIRLGGRAREFIIHTLVVQ